MATVKNGCYWVEESERYVGPRSGPMMVQTTVLTLGDTFTFVRGSQVAERNLDDMLDAGCKFTPLVCATPERIAALEDIGSLLGELLNSEETEAWLTPRRIDVIERKREAINAMLSEMKGSHDE